MRSPRGPTNAQKEDATEKIQTVEEIPLPNISETDTGTNISLTRSQRTSTKVRRPSILDFLRERIGIEEIVLLSLIILLLDESLDDELLLILLIYIFLT